MSTSTATRRYWVDVAKGWAEGRLTDNIIDPGGSTPQLDEFNWVMEELLEQDFIYRNHYTEVQRVRAENARLREAIGYALASGGTTDRVREKLHAALEAKK